MARKSTDIDNSDIINLFNLMGIEEYYDCPKWIRNCIESSSRVGHSNPSSFTAIFYCLFTLPRINFNSIQKFVNGKSEVVHGRVYSDRHVYAFMNRVLSCRSSIDYHYWKSFGGCLNDHRNVFDDNDKSFRYFDGLTLSEIFTNKSVSIHEKVS